MVKYDHDEVLAAIKAADVDLEGICPDGSYYHFFEEEQALAVLLANNVCFVSGQDYIMKDYPPTCGIVVNCNDLFYWGCADAESVQRVEIESLYLAWRKGGLNVDKWCCLHRNLRPQVPIVKKMKEAGVWDEALESLPAPEP